MLQDTMKCNEVQCDKSKEVGEETREITGARFWMWWESTAELQGEKIKWLIPSSHYQSQIFKLPLHLHQALQQDGVATAENLQGNGAIIKKSKK